MSKAKLLIVGSFPKRTIYGGIYSSCRLIISSPHFLNFEIIKFDSTQISNPPPNILIRFFLAGIRLIRFLRKLLNLNPRIALIFCSDGGSAIEKGLMIWICSKLKIKSIIFPRAGNLINQTHNSKTFKSLVKSLFKKTDIFFAQGENWKTYAIEELGIDIKKVKIIHNWTASKEFLKVGEEKTFKIKKDKTNFLFVGWLEKEKGIIELLNALKFLKEKKYKFECNFLGNGTLMGFSNHFIKENGLDENVFLRGWIEPSRIRKFYKSSDIFVLPSWSEGMPNSLIEAISCGLASIVTDVGMISNYLKNYESALILPTQNIDNLKKSMEKLILDNDLLQKLSKNGHLISKQYFSTELGLKNMAKSIKMLN